MSIERLQPLQLNDREKSIERFLETFEMDYPGMLVDVVTVEDVLREMPEGEVCEV